MLRRAWYGLNQAFRRRIAHTGLTPDQFTAMRTILEHQAAGLTQQGLTERMSSDPNTVASLVERMEGMGLVRRESHESDRRARILTLTPVGRVRFTELRRAARLLQNEVLAVLPEDLRPAFLEQLEQVADACRTAANRAVSPSSPRRPSPGKRVSTTPRRRH